MKISLKNVGYEYPTFENNKNGLYDVSLEIDSHKRIAIVGHTGSGKSTLVNLIPRFYDATKGQVLINGTNVKDYTLNRLRSMIGIVPQKAVLFKGTLMENLKWGKKYATIDEIETDLEISQSSSFVQAFPEKYDTNILQSGKNLSGGQKQRLTIARALVSNPEILILDDSSSALDFATDASLRKALKEKVKNTTVIMVSQRASSIKNADKIIVLNNGEIVGIGKHDYLINNCEVYKEICSSQLKN